LKVSSRLAAALSIVGAVLVTAGVAAVSIPAGLICAGLLLIGGGLFVVDVDGDE